MFWIQRKEQTKTHIKCIVETLKLQNYFCAKIWLRHVNDVSAVFDPKKLKVGDFLSFKLKISNCVLKTANKLEFDILVINSYS